MPFVIHREDALAAPRPDSGDIRFTLATEPFLRDLLAWTEAWSAGELLPGLLAALDAGTSPAEVNRLRPTLADGGARLRAVLGPFTPPVAGAEGPESLGELLLQLHDLHDRWLESLSAARALRDAVDPQQLASAGRLLEQERRQQSQRLRAARGGRFRVHSLALDGLPLMLVSDTPDQAPRAGSPEALPIVLAESSTTLDGVWTRQRHRFRFASTDRMSARPSPRTLQAVLAAHGLLGVRISVPGDAARLLESLRGGGRRAPVVPDAAAVRTVAEAAEAARREAEARRQAQQQAAAQPLLEPLSQPIAPAGHRTQEAALQAAIEAMRMGRHGTNGVLRERLETRLKAPLLRTWLDNMVSDGGGTRYMVYLRRDLSPAERRRRVMEVWLFRGSNLPAATTTPPPATRTRWLRLLETRDCLALLG